MREHATEILEILREQRGGNIGGITMRDARDMAYQYVTTPEQAYEVAGLVATLVAKELDAADAF